MADATCEKCDQYYTDPRILPCLHSFCLGCLEKELETQGTLHCPNCKEKVTLPQNGVAGLSQDVHLAIEADIARISEKVEGALNELCQNCGRTDSTGRAVAYCIECKGYLCELCKGCHSKKEITAKHSVLTVGQRWSKTTTAHLVSRFHDQPMYCPLHKSYTLEIYCKQCQKLICRNCMDFKHRSHHDECELAEDIASQERDILRASEGDTKETLATLNAAIATCYETVKQVQTRKQAVDLSIKSGLEVVHKALQEQNERICSNKVAGLKVQINQLEKVRDGLDAASAMITKAYTNTPAELLATRKVFTQRAVTLHKEFQASNLVPCESASFVTDLENAATISNIISIGSVSGGLHPQSSTCNAGYLPRLVVGKSHSFTVVSMDRAGKPVSQGGDTVAVKLVPVLQGETIITGEVIDNVNGTYRVTFTPKHAGAHELHVTIANGHLKGSPFSYNITEPTTNYTALSNCATFGTYKNPWDVAVMENGGFAAAELGYNTVSLYTESGQRFHTFGLPGTGGREDGQFYSPSGLAIKGDLMYVSDLNNHRVQKFSIRRRAFMSTFGSSGKENGQFSDPRGICIDPEGNIFIANNSTHQIHVFDKNDQFLYSFPCQEGPWGIAFDHEGYLHVAAFSSNCVHVVKPDGNRITSYGSGTLNHPAGIAIDGQGYIAISEYGGSQRLWIYSPEHEHVHTLSNQFSYGTGIACYKDGAFLVADYSNSRIQKFA